MGTTGEDSVIMPDPLPTSGQGTRGRTTTTAPPIKPNAWTSSFPGQEVPSGASASSVTGGVITRPKSAGGDITPFSTTRTWANGPITRLQTPRVNSFNSGKDDMEVFSPLVDVQPITPSMSSYWDTGGGGDEFKKEIAAHGADSTLRKTGWGSPTSSVVRRFPSVEDVKEEPRRSSLGSRQVITFFFPLYLVLLLILA